MPPFTYEDIICLYLGIHGTVQNEGTFTYLEKSLILDLRRDVDLLGELLAMGTGGDWTANHYNWKKGTTTSLPTHSGSTSTQIWWSYYDDLRSACEDLYTAASLGSPSWTITPIVPLYTAAFVVISGNESTYTDARILSLYQDVRTAILAVADTVWIYIDSENGNDTTGTGTTSNPYETWEKGINVINTASTGNLFMKAGSYTSTSNTLTVAGTIIQGVAPDLVALDVSILDVLAADGITVKSIDWNTSAGGRAASGRANLAFNNCVLRTSNPAYDALRLRNAANATLGHCSFIGTGDNTDAGLHFTNHTGLTATVDDCLFYDLANCIIGSNGTVNLDYCGFYDYTTKTSGGTFNSTNEVATDPAIAVKATGYLGDTDPAGDYISGASDGGDIGVDFGQYNILRDLSDEIEVDDPQVVDTHEVVVSDEVVIVEDMTLTNINLTVEMLLGGLFESSPNGTITYLDKNATIAIDTSSYTYNGASADVSYTSATGNSFELYIVVDDGVTDYSSMAWWEANAYKYGDPSRNYAGLATGSNTYFIDSWKDIAGNEWGSSYAYTVGTADGVNDQIATVTIKIRAKNIVTGDWSELITASKAYGFNDFDDTMYYCADNPLMVDGEYANHANYLAQPYHTGTTKYTRPDGIDWIADDRRFVYYPGSKISLHMRGTTTTGANSTPYEDWQNRNWNEGVPLQHNHRISQLILYTCIYGNFGNWNDSSAHCFATTTTQAKDRTTITSMAEPVFGSGANDLHYLRTQIIIGNSDCLNHNSHQGAVVRLPSGENMVWQPEYLGEQNDYSDSQISFSNGVACCTGTPPPDYLALKMYSTPFSCNEGTFPYIEVKEWVNTDISGSAVYGELAPQKQHSFQLSDPTLTVNF
jgi:hypothetical protein